MNKTGDMETLNLSFGEVAHLMKEVPISEKVNLTIEETTKLTNIGRDKIRELVDSKDCNFTLQVGRKTLIKRELFINYLMKRNVI